MKINGIEIPNSNVTYGVVEEVGACKTGGNYDSMAEALKSISRKDCPGDVKSLSIHAKIVIREITVTGLKDDSVQTDKAYTFKDRDELRDAISFMVLKFDVVDDVSVTTMTKPALAIRRLIDESEMWV